LNQCDVGVFSDALEHDMLAIGRHVKAKNRVTRSKPSEATARASREIEQPEILVAKSAELYDDSLAAWEKPDSCRRVGRRAVG
jgi:hypothetical protein